jgi:hypothetical protein
MGRIRKFHRTNNNKIEVNMILVTGIEFRGRQEVISGVLLDPVLPGGYANAVFIAFLSSDRIREILCEKPQYDGAHGHTRDGLIVSEFTSHLHGVCAYSHEPLSPVNILIQIVENRIELVTTANLDGCVYPAFLALAPVPPPVSTRVVVKLENMHFGGFPEVQAFAETDSYILEQPSINDSVKCGITLPVQWEIQGTSFRGALKLFNQLGPTEFEAMVYHEPDQGPFPVGIVLTRNVGRQKPDSHNEQVEFSAKIGTIVGFDE